MAGDCSCRTPVVTWRSTTAPCRATKPTVTAAGSQSSPAYAGDLTISGSTISGNTAGDEGGGIYENGLRDTNLIQSSTISGNRSADDGGGIYFARLYDDDETTVRNSTIAANVAGAGSSGDYLGGGIFLYAGTPASLNLSSTIVADNSAADGDLGQGPHAGGFVTGFSLIEDPGDAEITVIRPAPTSSARTRGSDRWPPTAARPRRSCRRWTARRSTRASPTGSPPTSAAWRGPRTSPWSRTRAAPTPPTSARPRSRRGMSRLRARARSSGGLPAPTTARRSAVARPRSRSSASGATTRSRRWEATTASRAARATTASPAVTATMS